MLQVNKSFHTPSRQLFASDFSHTHRAVISRIQTQRTKFMHSTYEHFHFPMNIEFNGWYPSHRSLKLYARQMIHSIDAFSLPRNSILSWNQSEFNRRSTIFRRKWNCLIEWAYDFCNVTNSHKPERCFVMQFISRSLIYFYKLTDWVIILECWSFSECMKMKLLEKNISYCLVQDRKFFTMWKCKGMFAF